MITVKYNSIFLNIISILSEFEEKEADGVFIIYRQPPTSFRMGF
jgi:hypothetical protein